MSAPKMLCANRRGRSSDANPAWRSVSACSARPTQAACVSNFYRAAFSSPSLAQQVGTSYNTPEFAVDCIENWWRAEGQLRYADADSLAILADGGGSNGSNCLAKATPASSVQSPSSHRHCRTTLPTGTSKWNPIDTACSANSAKTGQAAQWIVSRPSSLRAHDDYSYGSAVVRTGSSKGAIRRVSRSPTQRCRRLPSKMTPSPSELQDRPN